MSSGRSYIPQSPYPAPGEVIDGKYQIDHILGEGGMGAVARAIHLVLRAPVALKFMNPQYMALPGAVDRFLNEGIASKAIASEHVVQVDDVGKLPTGAPYLVMDCLEGRDLERVLKEDGTPHVPVERAVHFTVQILRGLQAAHAAGVVHRDMKPSNCFVVVHDGDADFVKILDFGISKVVVGHAPSLTQTNSALGTPLYMSPEQAKNPKDVDARSDLYSVGVILYELLCGRTPFQADSGQFTEVLFKLFTADPPRLSELRPDLPAALVDVVHHALRREPGDRYASALAMAEALTPFAARETRQLIARMGAFVPRSRSIAPAPVSAMPSRDAFSLLDAHGAPPRPSGHGAALTPERNPLASSIPGPPRAPLLHDVAPDATILRPDAPRHPLAATVAMRPSHPPPTTRAPSFGPADALVATSHAPGGAHAANRSPALRVVAAVAALAALGGAGYAAMKLRPPASTPDHGAGLVAQTPQVTPAGSSLPQPLPDLAASAAPSASASASGASASAPPQGPPAAQRPQRPPGALGIQIKR